MTLNISEIFYSLQGEGYRTGEATIFIRLQGCKAKEACYASGIRCDTEFESGHEMSLDALYDKIEAFRGDYITWTGGEPAQQLTFEIVEYFKQKGYQQSIETSGLFSVPSNLDFVSVSPKVAEHVIKRNFERVNELRYVRHKGQQIPAPSIEADNYYISPHFNGFQPDYETIQHCVQLCLDNPQWKLSLQTHKLISIL